MMRNPMHMLREFIERNWPDQEFNEDAWNRAIDYCEQPEPQIIIEKWDGEEWWLLTDETPRCDITGQPLTTRERFDRECG